MIEALISGERRGSVMAGLAPARLRTAGKMAGLSMALTGRFTAHHALMCGLHRDRITVFDDAVAGLDAAIAPLVARYAREAGLRKTLPGFGDVIAAGWLGAIGPAPHQHFATAGRLASWAAICPGNYRSAKKSKGGRTGGGGAYLKPLLIQAAWAAIRVPGRLQARFRRLVRKFGGPRNKGAINRAITAIAHTLLKIAYSVPKTGKPYAGLGADFCTRRQSPDARQDYLMRQPRKLNPPAASSPSPPRRPADRGDHLITRPPRHRSRLPAPPARCRRAARITVPAHRQERKPPPASAGHRPGPRHVTGQDLPPRTQRRPNYVSVTTAADAETHQRTCTDKQTQASRALPDSDGMWIWLRDEEAKPGGAVESTAELGRSRSRRRP
jgi:transposase